MHNAICILIAQLGGENYLTNYGENYLKNQATAKEKAQRCIIFSRGIHPNGHLTFAKQAMIKHFRELKAKQKQQGKKEVIVRGKASNLTEVLVSTLGFKAMAIYDLLQSVFDQIPNHNARNPHFLAHPAYKNILNTAKDLALEHREHLSWKNKSHQCCATWNGNSAQALHIWF